MEKSKEFILKREIGWQSYLCTLKYVSGKRVQFFHFSYPMICYRSFSRFFGFKLKPGESKRIKITIEFSEQPKEVQ